MKDLKDRTVRGGVVIISALALKFVLRTGSLVVLARFLTPNDFGLVRHGYRGNRGSFNIQGCRTFHGHSSAPYYHERTDFHLVLAQYVSGCSALWPVFGNCACSGRFFIMSPTCSG